jgi:hypothetical protein
VETTAEADAAFCFDLNLFSFSFCVSLVCNPSPPLLKSQSQPLWKNQMIVNSPSPLFYGYILSLSYSTKLTNYQKNQKKKKSV